MTDRPKVIVEPGVLFGCPHVNTVATEQVATMVWAGEPVETAGKEYGLFRGQVLVACWYEARYGRPRTGYRTAWRRWALTAQGAMWDARAADYDVIPDPPSKEVSRRGAA